MPVTSTKSRSPGWSARSALTLTRRLSAFSSTSEDGLTLIEGLVAIIVIAVTIVSITPPIFWATGTRVKNRKTEQALQIAQGEIDRVRTTIERDTYSLNQLPPVAGSESVVRSATVLGPTTLKTSGGNMVSAIAGCNSSDGTYPTGTSVREYILVDTDPETSGPCKPEFMIQTFRSLGVDENGVAVTGTTLPVGFVMGVRVYSIIAESSLKNGQTLQTKQGSLQGSSGLGQQRLRPLAVQYSTIVKSSTSQNLDVYRTLCPATSKNTGQC